MALTCNGGGRGGADGSLSNAKPVTAFPAELPEPAAAAMLMLHDAQVGVFAKEVDGCST